MSSHFLATITFARLRRAVVLTEKIRLIRQDPGRSRLLAVATLLTTFALSVAAQVAPLAAQPAQQPAPPAQPQPPPTPAPAPPRTTPAQPAPAPTTAAAPVASEYRIARGDKLRVEVYKDTYLSQSLQVRPDGRITLPLVGDLAAAGLTSIELRDRIANSLKEYIANPVVTVIVVEVVEPVVYVMGEVNQPGSVPMRGPMTVLQALAVAGGFKEFANTKGIRILRRNGDATKVETIAFNYKDAVKPDAQVVYLREGDTVVVP
jgi:polysaccharide export outer membrane protein